MKPLLVDLSPSWSGPIGVGLPEARSRQDVLRHTFAVVLDVAQTWPDDESATVDMNPLLRRADVQSAFDEISEKLHVAGINLRFDELEDGRLQAIFEPCQTLTSTPAPPAR